jgi:ribosomal protein S18 acetylase RimI-like enzyme
MRRDGPDRTDLRAFTGPVAAVGAHGLTFRRITDVDLRFAFDLYADVRAAELAPVPWTEDEKRRFLLQQAELQHRHYFDNYPGADLLLIEDGASPIGRVYVYRSPGEIRLMDIALRADRRNRGIGSAMLRELMDEASAVGSTLTLHVEPENPAQRLYRRLGFRLIEHRGVYDFLGWNPGDGVS